jgi:hypothetical protein
MRVRSFLTVFLFLNFTYSYGSDKNNARIETQFKIQQASYISLIAVSGTKNDLQIKVKPFKQPEKNIKLNKTDSSSVYKLVTKIQKQKTHKAHFCDRFRADINIKVENKSKTFCLQSITKPAKLVKKFLNQVEILNRRN